MAEQSFWLLTIEQGTPNHDTHSQNIITSQCITSPQSISNHCEITNQGIISVTVGSHQQAGTAGNPEHHNGRTTNPLGSVLVHSWIHATLLLWCLHTLRCCCGCTCLRVSCCTICGVLLSIRCILVAHATATTQANPDSTSTTSTPALEARPVAPLFLRV